MSYRASIALLLGCLLTWLLTCLAASPLHAQPAELELALANQTAVAAGLGYFSQSEYASSAHAGTLRLDVGHAFDGRFAIEGRMGLVLLGSSPDAGPGDLVLRPGNPTVLGSVRGAGERFSYRVSIGGAAPLAVVDAETRGRLHRAAYNYAAAMSGLYELSLWAQSRGAVLGSGRLDLHVIDRSWLAVELEPSLLIPARGLFTVEPVRVVIPAAASFGQRGPFGFGLRVQAVLLPGDESDALALSLGPWARFTAARGFMQLAYLANVFEPLAGERGPGIWGLRLSSGGVW